MTLVGRDDFPHLIVRSRWIGITGAAMSGALLIYDLGRPERFLHMLRVFRPTSPMNPGAWIFSGFSMWTGASAIVPRPIGDAAGVAAGLFGLALSGYTGVLVSNTVVPVWQRPHRILPLLFLAWAAASASSLLDFFGWNGNEDKAVVTFGAIGKVAHIVCCQLAEQRIGTWRRQSGPCGKGCPHHHAGRGDGRSTSHCRSVVPALRNSLRWPAICGKSESDLSSAFEMTGRAALTGPGIPAYQSNPAAQTNKLLMTWAGCAQYTQSHVTDP